MRFFEDDAYVFSVLGHDLGTILACRSTNILEQAGKNLFDCLRVDREEISFFKQSFLAYDNMAIAVLCGKKTKRVMLLFRQFAEASGLCLAVVLHFNAEDVSAVLKSDGFENVVMSDALSGLTSSDADSSYAKYSEIYKYISRLFMDISTMSFLRLQYGTENPETVRLCADTIGDLAGIVLDLECYLGECEEAFLADDIFDGRFCVASLLLLSFVARCYGEDCALKMEIVKGLKSFRIKCAFKPRSHGWEKALEHLKNVVLYTTGMSFNYELSNDRVEIGFIPFYADEGLAGVKEGEWRFSIVDFRNYF